jgi:sugar lactone lactonase YvrE
MNSISMKRLWPSVLPAKIKVVDPSYKLVRLVKDTPLPGCNGAIIGNDGALYVAHASEYSISRIDLKTKKITKLVPNYAGVFIPDDLTQDDQGNFYVTGMTPLVGEVYRLDKNGMKTVIGKGFLAPNGIQYNRRTGRLFMSECFYSNRVFELDPAGIKEPRLLVKENVLAIPEGFGFDPDTNDLIIPDTGAGKIVRVHPDTGAVTTIAEGFDRPIALKVGPDKMAYFPEWVTGAVYRLSLDGKKTEKLAQLPPGLDNLAITPKGRLFITSYWEATVYEVATDGSGKFKTLFPTGPNIISGIVYKKGRVWISDCIMLRGLEKHKFVPTKLNMYTCEGMITPIFMSNGPGGQVIWLDDISNDVMIGNPLTGEFKAIAGGLNRPMSALMSKDESKVYVGEYGSGQIIEINLADGAKRIVTTGLEGPVSLALVGQTIYVSGAKLGRISKVDLASGKKEVFLAGVVGRVGNLAYDGAGNLLAMDDSCGRLLRINLKNLAISVVAINLPVRYSLTGSYPGLENHHPWTISPQGDIYIPTAERGLIMLQKVRR